ncbi:unnamed protein product, partial [Penicillium discolor]
MRHHERLDVEHLALIPHAHGSLIHPGAAAQVGDDVAGQRMRLRAVEGAGTLVHEVDDRRLHIAETVPDDPQGDEEGRNSVEPPYARADAQHSDDGGDRRLPVGLGHVGVGVEQLVVQDGGELGLGRTVEEHRPDDHDGHDGDHQPAEPDRLAENLHGADGRMLPADEPGDGLGGEVQADREERDTGDEVADAHRAVVDVMAWLSLINPHQAEVV